MSSLFCLTGVQMARLEPFFLNRHGKPRVDGRRVQSAIILFYRNGLRWCDALGRMVRQRPGTIAGNEGVTRVLSRE